MNVYHFSNGNTVIFDDNGEQMPELQESWFKIFLDSLESKGIDPTTMNFIMPRGEIVEPFKTEHDWNWKLMSK